MDFRLKEIILNCTLMSYKITSIESVNVLKVTMKFHRGYKYKTPSKRRRDRLRKKGFWPSSIKMLSLFPAPYLDPGQLPHPSTLGGPVSAVVASAMIKQIRDAADKIYSL